VSEAEFDRVMSTAFGRTPAVDETLLRELEEAGTTAAGARGVLRWLEDGVSAEEAVSLGVSFGHVQPGKVAGLVQERALGVVRRHRPDVAAPPAGSPSGSTVSESASSSSSGRSAYEGGEVAAAREAVVQAALERDRKYVRGASEEQRRRIAESAAGGVVDGMTDWAVREGWTHQHLAERLRERAEAIRADRPGPRSQPGTGSGAARRTSITEDASITEHRKFR
jgi:hypothetical protein